MKYADELKVGAAIAAAIFVFFFGVRYFQDIPLFRGSYNLHTHFREVGGLVTGNPIQIHGVTVGDVTSVRLDQENQRVRVQLRISNDVQIPEGSIVQLSGWSQFGGTRLVIQPGPTGNPPLENGAFIPSSQQENILGTLSDQAAPLLGRADTLLGTANRTFREVNDQLGQPSSDLRTTLGNLRSVTDQLDQLLREERTRLRSILENTEGLTQNLEEFSSENRDSIARTVEHLNAALRRTESTLGTVDRASASLDSLARGIQRGEGTLGLLARDSTLYHRLDSTAAGLNDLVRDFRENPRRYLQHLKMFQLF